MLDEVVGKEKGAKGSRKKRRQLSSLLCDQSNRAARESCLLWCVFGGFRMRGQELTQSPVFFRYDSASTWQQGKQSQPKRPRAALASGKGEPFGNLRLCSKEGKK